MKYRYILLVATHSFNRSLLKLIESLIDLPEFRIVVVVNGSDTEGVLTQYLELCDREDVQFVSVQRKGKSLALNSFIKTLTEENVFLIFTDDDIYFPRESLLKYIRTVEKTGRGYFFGGGVDVIRIADIDPHKLLLYPLSIRGVPEDRLDKLKIFLGCNWGAFAEDIQMANYFNPYFGPGSITGSVGQESQMMYKLLHLGLKPFPIFDCRVTHFAPSGYHQPKWLYKRKFREGVQNGLLSKKRFLKIFVTKAFTLVRKDSFRKKADVYFLLGMLYSLKYYFVKFE